MSGSNAELIIGATSDSYETSIFTEKEIRYYYCVLKIGSEEKQSAVAAVAYTGLPILYLDTGEVPTSSITRDAYVLGSLRIVSEQYGNLDYHIHTEINSWGTKYFCELEKLMLKNE